MTKSVSMVTSDPSGSAITHSFGTADFADCLRVLEQGPRKVIYTDITAPVDQPSTIRIAQTSRPNIYAGTSIDPSMFLPTRKGTDTIIEVREVWSIVDSVDTTYLGYAPVRAALTLTLPDGGGISAVDVLELLGRVIGMGLAADESDVTLVDGATNLLHGVVDTKL